MFVGGVEILHDLGDAGCEHGGCEWSVDIGQLDGGGAQVRLKVAYVRKVMEEMMAMMDHFRFSGQLRGLAGSSGPSHDTTFGSTGSAGVASASPFSMADVPCAPASRSRFFSGCTSKSWSLSRSTSVVARDEGCSGIDLSSLVGKSASWPSSNASSSRYLSRCDRTGGTWGIGSAIRIAGAD